MDIQVLFIRYISDHLMQRAKDVTRLRSYICPSCGSLQENRRAIQMRLERGMKDILCAVCEERVPLIDAIEEKFASEDVKHTVREMEDGAQVRLDDRNLRAHPHRTCVLDRGRGGADLPSGAKFRLGD